MNAKIKKRIAQMVERYASSDAMVEAEQALHDHIAEVLEGEGVYVDEEELGEHLSDNLTFTVEYNE